MNIHITKNGQQLGPYTVAEVQNLIAAGSLQPTDFAWHDGIPNWVPLNQVPGIIFGASSPPPVPSAGRPVLVWVISLFYFIATPFSLLSMAMIPVLLSGTLPISETQRAYFESQTAFDYAIAGATILVNLAGAILLFTLRRPALYCFVGTFIIGIINLTYQIICKNWLASIGSNPAGMIGAAIGAVIGFGINLAIILYVWHLFRKGVLR